MQVAVNRGITQRTVGIGFSNRTGSVGVMNLAGLLFDAGGVFYRNASGALSLAYVASGNLLAYCEQHMNAWDCLAGQLLVVEAGGRIEKQSAAHMLIDGGRVVVGCVEVFDELIAMANKAYVE